MKAYFSIHKSSKLYHNYSIKSIIILSSLLYCILIEDQRKMSPHLTILFKYSTLMFMSLYDLFDLIKALPSRTYRDSADVAVALGELKSGKEIRSEEEVETTEQLGRKGGRTAATTSISAAAIARVLSGIEFPKKKSS